jgi:hypothetical protein
VLIYTTDISSRVLYVGETLFHTAVSFTDSREKFQAFSGVKINYANENFCAEALWVVPQGLLSEKIIHEQLIDCFEWEGLKVFFKTDGDIPFDIFAASFYLISRYEEYLPHELDEYGRYAHTNSLAYKEGFLHLPLVNLWMKIVNGILEKKFPYSKFKIHRATRGTKFKITPTYDIDIAYSYLHQPLLKNIFGFYRDLLRGKFDQVAERANVYSGRKKDPFDVYDWLDGLHERYGLKPVYFFLLAEKRKGVDKNSNPHTKGMQDLIQRHVKHPSWQSGDSDEVLKTEMRILSKVTGKNVERSRQHYLRMRLPITYRRLINEGIKEEYSMAYGTVNGFRASYALPFRWFDLEKGSITSLMVHSFCYMDSTAVFQQRETEEVALTELQHYFDIVKSVDGELITLFHNDFLTEQPEWMGWRKMYADFLERNLLPQINTD